MSKQKITFRRGLQNREIYCVSVSRKRRPYMQFMIHRMALVQMETIHKD